MISRQLGRRAAVVFAFALALGASACTKKLAISVELAVPERPDPFEGVRSVHLVALEGGHLVDVGGGRWDQGPLDLPVLVAPEVERLVVEGRDTAGALVASGATGVLDLLHAPPDGPLEVLFTRVGALSVVSASGRARVGGLAVQLAGDAVLFVGGAGEDGCPLETTELYAEDARRALVGPPLTEGRTGAFRAVPLTDGRVLVAGGEMAPEGCGARVTEPRIALLDPVARTGRLTDLALPVRLGASVLAVSETLAIVAGGDGPTLVSADVERLNPRTLELQTTGKLDLPRAEAAAANVSGGRVMLAGGRSRLADDSALDDVVLFDPGRGAGSAERFELGAPTIGGAIASTLTGGAILAGGRDAAGRARDRVVALVAEPERAQAFGDTSTVAALRAPSAAGRLVDLEDGSLLYLPAAGGALTRIDLLPARAAEIALPAGLDGALSGGRVGDGTVVLRAPTGATAVFNPGPTAALGTAAVEGLFSSDAALGPGLAAGLGIVPTRPSAWRFEGGRLFGRLLPTLPRAGVYPGELAVLGRSRLGDFDVAFELTLEPLSQASFVFGLEGGELDEVVFLGGLTLVSRSRLRAASSPLVCDSRQTPHLAERGAHRIRVRRTGSEVRVDVGRGEELVCLTPSPSAGHIAFGVVAGEVSFAAFEDR